MHRPGKTRSVAGMGDISVSWSIAIKLYNYSTPPDLVELYHV